MAAASYYDTADARDEKTQLSPSRGPQSTGIHSDTSTQSASHELHQSGGEQRGFPQQGYNEQIHHGMPQQGSNEQYLQQSPHEQNSGVYGDQQQQMGQHNSNNNYTHGGGQQMNSTGDQATMADNRDTMTKWLDRIEKRFGGERFNNPENADKNRRLNENILRRLKQVTMLVVQRAPRMLMNMGR